MFGVAYCPKMKYFVSVFESAIVKLLSVNVNLSCVYPLLLI